jgi:hypothetical protein
MVKLTKAIIKKYGISKKAWAVARGQKSSLSRTKKTKVYTMARRKKSFSRKLFKSRSGKSKGNFFGTALKILSGTVLAVAYEVFVSPLIPLSAMIKNIIELVVGLVLAVMPKMPMVVRGFGTALAVVNAYAIVYPMIAGTAQGSVDF